MAGAKLQRNFLAQKAASLIDSFVEEHGFNYKVSNSDTKIRTEQFNKVVYPDAVVICEQTDYYRNRRDIITNPLVIVEVLSHLIEKHDRDSKFEWYRNLASFQDYVLVNQDYKRILICTRQPDNSWLLRDYNGDDTVAVLYALQNCPLPLKRLYCGLDL